MDMNTRLASICDQAVLWVERVLAVAILVGIVVFAVNSVASLAALDWRASETFYEAIYRVLVLVIAAELARTLVTHELRALVEMLAFVIARKMLKPDLDVLDLVLSVLAFVALLGASRYWLAPKAVAPRMPVPSASAAPTSER
jgi:hypothetical protein